MKLHVKNAILTQMYKDYHSFAQSSDAPCLRNHYSFSFRYLLDRPSLAYLIRARQSESCEMLRKLVREGYLDEKEVVFFLTEKGYNHAKKLLNPSHANRAKEYFYCLQKQCSLLFKHPLVSNFVDSFLLPF